MISILLLLLFQVCLTLVILYFLIKKSKEPKIINKDYKIKKIEIEESKKPCGIYSTLSETNEKIISDGDLIPFNISDKDKEILKMFYNK
jgi:hypothetical protein